MTGSSARHQDSASTRHAILEAAAALFAERGFDRTTVRDIAERAGANQALLFRYFGSKDKLFAAALARNRDRQLLDVEPDRLLDEMLRGIVTPESPEQRNRALEAVLRSMGTDSGATALRQEFGDEYTRRLASLSPLPDAELRGDLLLAWVLGVGLMYGVTGKESLTDADPERVRTLVLAAAHALLHDIP